MCSRQVSWLTTWPGERAAFLAFPRVAVALEESRSFTVAGAAAAWLFSAPRSLLALAQMRRDLEAGKATQWWEMGQIRRAEHPY